MNNLLLPPRVLPDPPKRLLELQNMTEKYTKRNIQSPRVYPIPKGLKRTTNYERKYYNSRI